MGSETPEELFPEAVRFFFTFAGHDDQATIIRGWMHAFPPAMFSGRAVPLIRKTVKDDWAELVQRVPELSEAAPGPAQLAETFR